MLGGTLKSDIAELGAEIHCVCNLNLNCDCNIFSHIMSSDGPIEDALVELFNALSNIAIDSICRNSDRMIDDCMLPAW